MMKQFLLTCLPILIATMAWSDQDHDEARELRLQGKVLPLTLILEQKALSGLETILEVELEQENNQWYYEIKGLSKHNRLIEFIVDADSGNIVNKEYKKHHRDHD